MPNKILRVFIDTNIWFSVFYGSVTCAKIINAHTDDRIKAVISQKVISELIRNIEKKLPRALPRLQKLLLNTPPEIVSDPENIDRRFTNLVHMKDQTIFSAAFLTKVDYFITGNTKDFSVKKLEIITGIKILTPKEAVKLLGL